MKVLVVGNMWLGSNARSLSDGFSAAGHETRSLDTTATTQPRRLSAGWREIRGRRSVGEKANSRVKSRLHDIEADWNPDLLVAFKTVLLDQSLLLDSRARLKVHYSPDDASNSANTSPTYLANEHRWDLVVTTKSYNVSELRNRGVRSVAFLQSAYDPAIHYGSPATPSRPYLFGFLGAARADRLDLPRILGATRDHRAIVSGPRWRRYYPLGWPNVEIRPPVDGSNFSRVAGQIFAGPVLLNSANRDLHTCRSFEVPACGLVTVAERTAEHQELYDEGSECLMFSSKSELSENLARIAADPSKYQAMAGRAQRRVTAGKNTYRDRADSIVREL